MDSCKWSEIKSELTEVSDSPKTKLANQRLGPNRRHSLDSNTSDDDTRRFMRMWHTVGDQI